MYTIISEYTFRNERYCDAVDAVHRRAKSSFTPKLYRRLWKVKEIGRMGEEEDRDEEASDGGGGGE